MNKRCISKTVSLLIILNCFVLELSSTLNKHAISYDFSTGRFGDHILSYAHASYLSYLTGIPLLYRSFSFSDQLNIYKTGMLFDKYVHLYARQFHVGSLGTLEEFFNQIRDPNLIPTLFIIDFFPLRASLWRADEIINNVVIHLPWKEDLSFINYLRYALSPCIDIPDFTKKDGRLNVAVHVRTLSGLDEESSLIGYPLKHPFYDYHKRQIKRVYEYNRCNPLYVFIFSDSKKPSELLNEFRESFEHENIEFEIQRVKDPDLNTTVQDFFAMQKFSVLIATQSHFSMIAAYLGSFDMYILPMHFEGQYPYYRINRVQVVSKNSDWFPYKLDITLKD